MIPKFNRPISAFALYVLAAASLLAAVVFFFDEGNPGASLAVPGVFSAAAILMFGLGRLIHLTAETAHYMKYLCWEQRLTNQLAEKKKSGERKIPPPLHFPQMDPMEKVFRNIDET